MQYEVVFTPEALEQLVSLSFIGRAPLTHQRVLALRRVAVVAVLLPDRLGGVALGQPGEQAGLGVGTAAQQRRPHF